jgi:hypothetical protein
MASSIASDRDRSRTTGMSGNWRAMSCTVMGAA